MDCLIYGITAWIIGESWLFANVALANPTLENTIAQRIENLKRGGHKWIEVDLSDQYLFAWEGSNQTFKTLISSGKATTPTYPGMYSIQRKYPQDRMRGADYDIADVPNVLYFDRGYALHGAYWHNNFGTPVSHGCINLNFPFDKKLQAMLYSALARSSLTDLLGTT